MSESPTKRDDMPALPEPAGVVIFGTQARRAFISDQMHAYAQQHAEQRVREERAEDERLLREAMEALWACRKKGARWHPCDPVATASDTAIAALRKRLGE